MASSRSPIPALALEFIQEITNIIEQKDLSREDIEFVRRVPVTPGENPWWTDSHNK